MIFLKQNQQLMKTSNRQSKSKTILYLIILVLAILLLAGYCKKSSPHRTELADGKYVYGKVASLAATNEVGFISTNLGDPLDRDDHKAIKLVLYKGRDLNPDDLGMEVWFKAYEENDVTFADEIETSAQTDVYSGSLADISTINLHGFYPQELTQDVHKLGHIRPRGNSGVARFENGEYQISYGEIGTRNHRWLKCTREVHDKANLFGEGVVWIETNSGDTQIISIDTCHAHPGADKVCRSQIK